MAAAELRFLRVFRGQLVSDAVEQLHVTLLRILLESRDERPRHCASSFATDVSVLPILFNICQIYNFTETGDLGG